MWVGLSCVSFYGLPRKNITPKVSKQVQKLKEKNYCMLYFMWSQKKHSGSATTLLFSMRTNVTKLNPSTFKFKREKSQIKKIPPKYLNQSEKIPKLPSYHSLALAWTCQLYLKDTQSQDCWRTSVSGFSHHLRERHSQPKIGCWRRGTGRLMFWIQEVKLQLLQGSFSTRPPIFLSFLPLAFKWSPHLLLDSDHRNWRPAVLHPELHADTWITGFTSLRCRGSSPKTQAICWHSQHTSLLTVSFFLTLDCKIQLTWPL